MLRLNIKRQLVGFAFLLCCFTVPGQNGCMDCTITLPDSLPDDTLFLAPAPDGEVGAFYQGAISFRVPQTTTPVAATDPNVPAGITISKFTIDAVVNLPPGLHWEASSREFDLPAETDGCVRFCGTPLQAGLFIVEVMVTARVFVVNEQTSFRFPLHIEAANNITEGFSAVNTVGCGEIETEFSNQVPSEAREGFSYFWDFGNGNISLAENPPSQHYDLPGMYEVDYRAIIDTTGFFLTTVRVEDVGCTDPFNNAPDLQVKVYDPEGEEVYASEVRKNSRPPAGFDLNIPVGPGDYSLVVFDDDDGLLGGDKTCGTFNFNRATSGALSDSDSKVHLTILHPVDTITSRDSIIVFEQPAPPVVDVSSGPYCQGDSVVLRSSYQQGNEWSLNDLPLAGQTDSLLTVTEGGRYRVTFTSPDGCRAISQEVALSFSPLPPEPVIAQDHNFLFLPDSLAMPADSRLEWHFNGELLAGAAGAALCADTSGVYEVRLTDPGTGCVNTYQTVVEFDPAYAGCLTDVNTFNAVVERVAIYPNPASGPLFLDLQLKRAQSVEVLLFSARGRLLQRQHRWLTAGRSTVELALDNLPGGVYLLQLGTESGRRSYKVIRQ